MSAERRVRAESLLARSVEPGTSARLHHPRHPPEKGTALASLIRDPEFIAARADDVQRILELGTPAPVAAAIPLSLVSLRVCGALVLPVLTCAAAEIALAADDHDTFLDWEPSHLTVSFSLGSLQPGSLQSGSDALAALIGDVFAPLGEVLAGLSLPPRVFWGNVASVIARSADLIAARHLALGPAAHRHARAALHEPRLARSWAGALGPTFRRTSCCQVADRRELAGRCGDCVFMPGTMSSCSAPS